MSEGGDAVGDDEREQYCFQREINPGTAIVVHVWYVAEVTILRFFFLVLALLCVAACNVSAQQQTIALSDKKSCRDEEALLATWQDRVVFSIAYGPAHGIMFVYPAVWENISTSLRKKLALAAYCQIRVKHGRGVLDISGIEGPAFGEVIDGDWRSRSAVK